MVMACSILESRFPNKSRSSNHIYHCILAIVRFSHFCSSTLCCTANSCVAFITTLVRTDLPSWLQFWMKEQASERQCYLLLHFLRATAVSCCLSLLSSLAQTTHSSACCTTYFQKWSWGKRKLCSAQALISVSTKDTDTLFQSLFLLFEECEWHCCTPLTLFRGPDLKNTESCWLCSNISIWLLPCLQTPAVDRTGLAGTVGCLQFFSRAFFGSTVANNIWMKVEPFLSKQKRGKWKLWTKCWCRNVSVQWSWRTLFWEESWGPLLKLQLRPVCLQIIPLAYLMTSSLL